MKNDSTFSTDEDMQEIALRATLHEHAPTDVNIDHAWMVVSSRCQGTSKQATARFRLPILLTCLSGRRSYPISLRARIVMGSLTFAVLLLLGINTLFPLLPGSGSVANADQYQQIGQSQSSGGLTITADKGYANDDTIAIMYTVQPSAKFMKNISSVDLYPFYTPKDQNSHNKFAGGCSNYRIWPLKCFVYLLTPHPTFNTNKVVINWDVTRVTLLFDNLLNYVIIHGNWHFHITLDIHPGKAVAPVLPVSK